MNKTIETAFKKLLGEGRAFRTPKGFMSDFLDLIVSPFSELKDRFLYMKSTHFPTQHTNEDDILNGEELFGITETEGQTFDDRAMNVETQWGLLNGSLNWKPLQDALKKLSINVSIVENVPPRAINIGSLSMYGDFQYNETLESTNDVVRYGINASRIIGNGIIQIEEKNTTLVKYKTGEFHNMAHIVTEVMILQSNLLFNMELKGVEKLFFHCSRRTDYIKTI